MKRTSSPYPRFRSREKNNLRKEYEREYNALCEQLNAKKINQNQFDFECERLEGKYYAVR